MYVEPTHQQRTYDSLQSITQEEQKKITEKTCQQFVNNACMQRVKIEFYKEQKEKAIVTSNECVKC